MILFANLKGDTTTPTRGQLADAERRYSATQSVLAKCVWLFSRDAANTLKHDADVCLQWAALVEQDDEYGVQAYLDALQELAAIRAGEQKARGGFLYL